MAAGVAAAPFQTRRLSLETVEDMIENLARLDTVPRDAHSIDTTVVLRASGLQVFSTPYLLREEAPRHWRVLGHTVERSMAATQRGARHPAAASEALERGEGPLRDWMLKQTRSGDLRLFLEISGEARPARGEALSMTVVIPAFLISALGTAFRMGPVHLRSHVPHRHPGGVDPHVAGHDDGPPQMI